MNFLIRSTYVRHFALNYDYAKVSTTQLSSVENCISRVRTLRTVNNTGNYYCTF